MVEDRIRALESRVQASGNIPDASKKELLDLLADLRAELRETKPAHQAESLDTLIALEAEHPKLASLANRVAVALANMGI
ncbi:MAG TPA: DUF4404 family protein [Chthoniobacteraceae bacterium]|jgi:hypothetical protein|nr:DUF4404 family protein [Chthoniobacteraceae bacterium]